MPIEFKNISGTGSFTLVNNTNSGNFYVLGGGGPIPTPAPTIITPSPTVAPTAAPTIAPTAAPTTAPTTAPTPSPTSAGSDLIRAQLSTSSGSYDAASVGNWVKITSTEYGRIAANVTGATKKGNNDTQVNTRSVLTSFSNNWIAFGTGSTPSFQIDTGEYVIAMITEAWNQSGGTSQLGYTTAFIGNTITNIGGTAGPSTGGNRDYFVRKAPTDAATETRYPTLFMTVSPNAVQTWSGYRSTNSGSTWLGMPNTQVSKIQIITTTTKSW